MDHKLPGRIQAELDMEAVRRISKAIYAHDRTLCYSAFAESAALCQHELAAYAGCHAEITTQPADGKTAALDCIMPQAWEFRSASLNVLVPREALRPLSSEEHGVFLVANRCHPTPPGGITAGVMTLADFEAGADVRGKFVFERVLPPAAVYARIHDSGAAGILSAYSEGPEDAPDSCWWINGWGRTGWYHAFDEDAKMLCFSCPPRWGQQLEELLAQGPVTVCANVDSTVYDGELRTVSAHTLGRAEHEIVLVSHLYEPFLSDNAIGAAGCIEIARVYNRLIQNGILPANAPRLRVLLSMELYGFSRYFEEPRHCRRTLCSINTDTIGRDIRKMKSTVTLVKSPASLPFFGDFLLRDLWEKSLAQKPLALRDGTLSDDMFMSDVKLGVPTSWLLTPARGLHHNGYERNENLTDWGLARELLACVAAYAVTLGQAHAAPDNTLAELTLAYATAELESQADQVAGQRREGRLSPDDANFRYRYYRAWQLGRIGSLAGYCDAEAIRQARERLPDDPHFAAAIDEAGLFGTIAGTDDERLKRVYVRKTPGVPMSLTKVPVKQRVPVPHSSYAVLNWCDGRRSLGECLRLAEFDRTVPFAPNEVKRLMDFMELLHNSGNLA